MLICGPLRKQKQTYNFVFLSCSLWGKFGEHQNKPQTHVITSPHQLFNILDDPVYEISAVRICSEDVMELVTTMAQEKCESSFKANVFIVAFTTSHARLKLYSALDTLKERVLYYDTDSVIYRWKPGQEKLPLGRYLGQFRDEIGGSLLWNLSVVAQRIMATLPAAVKPNARLTEKAARLKKQVNLMCGKMVMSMQTIYVNGRKQGPVMKGWIFLIQ